MKLNVILTVFKKEIIDLLRDRRTLLSMVALPVVVFPLVFGVMGRFMAMPKRKRKQKPQALRSSKAAFPPNLIGSLSAVA